MFTIRRDGNLVYEVVIKDVGGWDREYVTQLKIFDNIKSAKEVANVWENAIVEEYVAETA